jgi:hypothetical protein
LRAAPGGTAQRIGERGVKENGAVNVG